MSKNDYKQFALDAKTVTNKDDAINNFIGYALNKLQSMFTYTGLPETIPQKWLEYYLMVNGNVFITDVKADDIKGSEKYSTGLYAFIGGTGGTPDVYYQPTIYTVANPALNLSKQYKIDTDGVLIRNDSFMMGMLPTIRKYGALLVESDLTIRCALINLRIYNAISASDDATKKSADEYVKKIENGELSVIGANPFFDGVNIHNNTANANYLTQLIEITQYLKASFYNEIGLNANYNLKREYISTTENSLADDVLLPLADNMLRERQEGIKKVNEMYGTNITVDFSSAWKSNSTQNDKEIVLNETITGDKSDTPDADTPDTPDADTPDASDDTPDASDDTSDDTPDASDDTPDADASDDTPDADASDDTPDASDDTPDDNKKDGDKNANK